MKKFPSPVIQAIADPYNGPAGADVDASNIKSYPSFKVAGTGSSPGKKRPYIVGVEKKPSIAKNMTILNNINTADKYVLATAEGQWLTKELITMGAKIIFVFCGGSSEFPVKDSPHGYTQTIDWRIKSYKLWIEAGNLKPVNIKKGKGKSITIGSVAVPEDVRQIAHTMFHEMLHAWWNIKHPPTSGSLDIAGPSVAAHQDLSPLKLSFDKKANTYNYPPLNSPSAKAYFSSEFLKYLLKFNTQFRDHLASKK